MLYGGLKIRARREDWSGGIALLVMQQHGDGSPRSVATNLIMTTVEESQLVQPTLTIGRQEAQNLIDELWDCGLRPSEGSGSAGAMAATERHLADMRKLVFDAAAKP